MNHTRKAALIVIIVLLLDQCLKTWVRTHMYYGEQISLIGNWFKLNYIDNNGMAFGLEFAGDFGKLFLTLFRIAAVLAIGFLIRYCIRQKYNFAFIGSLCLIMAGALGNIIDSVFYGILYGYAPLFHGKVVDMIFFPLYHGQFPSWLPLYGSQKFTFFNDVFNIADSAIFIGVLLILLFQRSFLKNTLVK